MPKYIYNFGGDAAEGREDMRNSLGGKGAGLAEMTNLGMPVPPGFTITTEVCTYYMENESYPDSLEDDARQSLEYVEGIMGARFGAPDNPLLVSVRSGARVSMPGMMDTVLNLGINDTIIEGLIKRTNNPRFAYDSYRRFVQMYGDVVLGVKPKDKKDKDPFETALEELKEQRGVKKDLELTAEDLKGLVATFKAIIAERSPVPLPEDPWEQLWGAIGAVFQSWSTERAIAYRRLNNIPEDWGTAVNVQSMVYGNINDDCATGVAFTRDPATGEKVFYGEYLTNAQGEDVVAGIRTPLQISELKVEMPDIYDELEGYYQRLENHFHDMQDMEFTIQDKKLWMLQTRSGKRTGLAAVRIGVEMVDEGLITPHDALKRIEPEQLNQLLRPVFDGKEKKKAIEEGKLLAKGLNAGPGAASGMIYFNAESAVEAKKIEDDKDEKDQSEIILVRIETSPDDIKGMDASSGILTARGGMTSHAALVARQMGKVCVAGCGELNIDYQAGEMRVAGKVFKEGDFISLDGSKGEIIEGSLKTIPSEIIQVLIEHTLDPKDSPIYNIYSELMGWADEERRLKIRTNADQPDQCRVARAFGAEGIGLTRTEHMFFGGNRIMAVREMILADNEEGRRKALDKLLPMQREDFLGIFRVMNGLPVTIRTLDPPLHEFLPHTDAEIEELAGDMGIAPSEVKTKVEALREMNPMLGHRGCRLGNVYPEITEMQARAIIEAAVMATKEGVKVEPEIMIPLVGFPNELKVQEQIVRKVANEIFEAEGIKVDYLVGTMIELPRAAIVADQIAEVAEFFSFGTNDLTQTALGISRDDSRGFIPYYLDHKIITDEPFQTIDQGGVGKLMEWGVEKGRTTRSNLKIGICGEHGGEPRSVVFCHRIGLDYVSCSPYRIPIARLAAAQAALQDK
ncbi:MAG: pyruvate, phosphate dikinase [Candidatus Hatepunaea meridiana]|nr:pyruvate, phosphate dikinase [Candidatus Hatepunaea meridiana]